LGALNNLEDAPWGDLRGKELDSRALARRLGKYGISSKDVRIGDWHGKGYKREDFYDAWERYLNAADAEDKQDETPQLLQRMK
jgi:Protein of unknown function (DUF3631)